MTKPPTLANWAEIAQLAYVVKFVRWQVDQLPAYGHELSDARLRVLRSEIAMVHGTLDAMVENTAEDPS